MKWSPKVYILMGVVLATPLVSAASQTAAASSGDDIESRVKAVLAKVPLIDGHNDVPWAYRSRAKNHLDRMDFASDLSQGPRPMHTDLPRMRQGGVGGQFWSVYTPTSTGGPGAARYVLEQIDLVHRLIEKYPDSLQLALSTDDIINAHKAGRIASLMGMEGGHGIENSLSVLRGFYRAGVRYMTLAHSESTDWCDSCTGKVLSNGLSPFGEEVVREMNRMGMLVDLSHVTPEAMHDALNIVQAPVIFSHSSARALCDHPRNVPDDVLKRVAENDGIVMVTWVPSFISEQARVHPELRKARQKEVTQAHPGEVETIATLMAEWDAANPRPKATLEQVADHMDHVRRVAGIDHLGMGGDLDGVGSLPVGLEDVSTYPALLAELARRGYTDDDLTKVTGRNLLRVFRASEAAATRLQAASLTSSALYDELDGPKVDDTDHAARDR